MNAIEKQQLAGAQCRHLKRLMDKLERRNQQLEREQARLEAELAEKRGEAR